MRHMLLALRQKVRSALGEAKLHTAHQVVKQVMGLSQRLSPWLAKAPGATARQGLAADFQLLHLLTYRDGSAPPKPQVMRAQSGLMAQAAGLGFEPSQAPQSVKTFAFPHVLSPLKARFYRHPKPDAPLLLFFHGGGFVFGDLDSHDAPCRALLASAEVHVLSVEYRLAPEHPYPAAFEDAWAAYEWVWENGAKALGLETIQLVVGGDSAGGNLAAGVAQKVAHEGRELTAQLLIYPALDRRTSYPSLSRLARGFVLTRHALDYFTHHYTAARQAPEDFRLHPGLGELSSNLAPAYVVTAAFDPLSDEGAAYVARLKEASVRVEHQREDALLHGFINMVGVSEVAREATLRIGYGFKTFLEA